jgi:hypothetical protein
MKLTSDKDFIVICQSAWMNDSGFGISYDWDGERFKTRAKAIKHGWRLRDSDDFNIAELRGDELIWFGWMDQRMDEGDATMAEIAEAIGCDYTPRAALAKEPSNG